MIIKYVVNSDLSGTSLGILKLSPYIYTLMNLSELANRYLDDEFFKEITLDGSASREIYRQVQSKEYFIPLIATIFWQAFVYSDTFLSCIEKVGLKPDEYASRLFDSERLKQHSLLTGPNSFFVLGHRKQNSNHPRFDLLVFDEHVQGCKSLNLRQADVRAEELELGWIRFVRNVASHDRRLTGLQPSDSLGIDNIDSIFYSGAKAALELYETIPFGILFVKTPEVVPMTGAASPLIRVHLDPSSPPIATGGVITSNRKGQIGVTSALHAFSPTKDLDGMARRQTISLRNQKVFVNGQNGQVVSTDVLTDSCFIEVPSIQATRLRGSKGPLKGRVPRVGEPATFQGATAEGDVTNTIITAWSLNLPFIVPTVQSTILTTPDTLLGSSGSALIDYDDNILGFACLRSKYNEIAEFSMWIWAESVYLAHDLI